MFGILPLSAAPLSTDNYISFVAADAAINGAANVSCTGTLNLFASAEILGKALVTASEGAIQGEAAILGRAVVSANGGYSLEGAAAILAAANLNVTGGIIFNNAAAITGTATFTAIANNAVLASGSIFVFCEMSVNGGVITQGAASITSNAKASVTGMIYGEEWTKLTPASDTWLLQE